MTTLYIIIASSLFMKSVCNSVIGIMYVIRAVAAGPVSPVSTEPFFPSPVACLASPSSANELANAHASPPSKRTGDIL